MYIRLKSNYVAFVARQIVHKIIKITKNTNEFRTLYFELKKFKENN